MKNYNRFYRFIMTAMFIIFIFGIVILNMFTPIKEFSESENRVLEQIPKFSFKSLFKGQFTTSYEKYISDQFPLRDVWVGVKSRSDNTIGKKESNGVYLGKDGYLLQQFTKPTDDEFKSKIDAINKFDESVEGVNKYFMLVPTAINILHDKLPKYVDESEQNYYINKTKESINKDIKFVDVYNTLNSKKDEYIFYKTDHHWTTDGAYYAYETLGNIMGFTPLSKSDFKIKEVTNDFYGSLYSRGGFRDINPDSIHLYLNENQDVNVEYFEDKPLKGSLYQMENLKKKDKYTVFLGGNHPLIKIKTQSDSDRKVLLIKDSYANSFTPFLTSHFSEIYLVDLRYYGENIKDFISENGITDVLLLYNANTFFEDVSIRNLNQ